MLTFLIVPRNGVPVAVQVGDFRHGRPRRDNSSFLSMVLRAEESATAEARISFRLLPAYVGGGLESLLRRWDCFLSGRSCLPVRRLAGLATDSKRTFFSVLSV
jgi:hypothetical protein